MLGLWLTPTSLFLILNLVIGTIFILSRFTSHNKPHHDQHQHQHQLGRPSSLIDRVKSINFSLYKFPSTDLNTYSYQHTEPEQDPNRVNPPLTRTPSLLERVKSINFSSLYTPKTEPETHTEPDPDSSPGSDHGHLVKRSKSEIQPGSERVAEKIKKSATEKSMVVEEVEMVNIERTVSFGEGGDHGVDAKADDFINRFKHQLKLQRLESLLGRKGK